MLTLALHVPSLSWADEPTAEAGWATAQATSLTQQGRHHANQGDRETAIRRFMEAIRFDPTYAPAYLALSEAYVGAGDDREAERTLAVGIDHVPAFAEGFAARARLCMRHGRTAEAIADLEAATELAPDSIPLWRELASAYVAVRALPSALAVHRKIAALATQSGDAPGANEAHAVQRALAILVADADPVAAGKAGRGVVRRAIAGACGVAIAGKRTKAR